MSLVIGGRQAETPRHDGADDEAQSKTSHPHSLADAGLASTRDAATQSVAVTVMGERGDIVAPDAMVRLDIYNMTDAIKKRRIETELGTLMVRNMANVMERERLKRGLGKVDFAKLCGISAPSFLLILEGSANPTLYVITRISHALDVPVQELLFGQKAPRQ